MLSKKDLVSRFARAFRWKKWRHNISVGRDLVPLSIARPGGAGSIDGHRVGSQH